MDPARIESPGAGLLIRHQTPVRSISLIHPVPHGGAADTEQVGGRFALALGLGERPQDGIGVVDVTDGTFCESVLKLSLVQPRF